MSWNFSALYIDMKKTPKQNKTVSAQFQEPANK